MTQLRLHADLRWNGSRVAAKSFHESVWAGAGEQFHFPLYGMEFRPNGLMLATRTERGSFKLQVPAGATLDGLYELARPGDRAVMRSGPYQLTLSVGAVPQVITADWLYIALAPTVAAMVALPVLSWKVVVMLLALFARPTQPVELAMIEQVPTPVVTKPSARFVTPKPKPLPDDTKGRIEHLKNGGSMAALAKSPGKAEREAKAKAVKKELVAMKGMLKIIGTSGGTLYGAQVREQPAMLMAMIGTVEGSTISGGLGVSDLSNNALVGTGRGGGDIGVGLGTIGTIGTGSGGLGLSGYGTGNANPDRRRLGQEARDVVMGAKCGTPDEFARVRVLVKVDAAGSAAESKVMSATSPALGECVKRAITAHTFKVTDLSMVVAVNFAG